MKIQINRLLQGGAVALCLLVVTMVRADEVCLVDGGRANAVIVIPEDLPPLPGKQKHPLFIEFGLMQSHARASAEILAHYIHQSTGAELKIVTENDAPIDGNVIHVGRTKLAASRSSDLAAMDADGFLIAASGGSHVVIVGASPQGTEFGVYDFLERELGVRWLFPGELGEHVPARQKLCVSGSDRVAQPRFMSRIFRIKGEGGSEWTRRNRAHSRIEFHHNISKIVPVSWTRSHPEYFPLIDGERYLPKRLNQDDWHLCHSADGVVGAMADLLDRCFTRYPQYPSISLGVCDGGADRYCHCDPCLSARRNDAINSLGYHDYADEYYRWCNEVLERVAASYPDKRFGCLAYREVGDPPSFQVHDNLVPYLTYELLQWADPERRAAWKQQVDAWSKRAKHFGHYEYLFGEQYMLVPRLYRHALADYCRYAAEQGAIGFYAETTGTHASTSWYAGPQPYILLRLLWNPDVDVDALLSDWCMSAVGPAAAPHLEDHFRHWERIWTQEVVKTAWYGSRSRTYLKFNSDEYLAAVRTSDLDHSEQLLAKAVDAAATGVQRQRAEMFLAEFRKRRAERLEEQVAVWDAQRRVDVEEAGTPIFRASFDQSGSGWSALSSNDSEPATHDATQGALRFAGDSSIVGPMIDLDPGRVYVVSWRVRSHQAPANAKITFIMEGHPNGAEGSALMVQRNVFATELAGDWQHLRYAFKSRGAPMRLRCALLVRSMKTGEMRLDEVTVAPLTDR